MRSLCLSRLQQLGFVTTLQPFASGTNVLGEYPGSKEPEKRVVISAHYDHVVSCPGADDNASGVTAVLESARLLSTVKHDRTLDLLFALQVVKAALTSVLQLLQSSSTA